MIGIDMAIEWRIYMQDDFTFMSMPFSQIKMGKIENDLRFRSGIAGISN